MEQAWVEEVCERGGCGGAAGAGESVAVAIQKVPGASEVEESCQADLLVRGALVATIPCAATDVSAQEMLSCARGCFVLWGENAQIAGPGGATCPCSDALRSALPLCRT